MYFDQDCSAEVQRKQKKVSRGYKTAESKYHSPVPIPGPAENLLRIRLQAFPLTTGATANPERARSGDVDRGPGRAGEGVHSRKLDNSVEEERSNS